MDIVPKVAVEIARQVVPDEIYQAPLTAENFVKGGKNRKELLRQAREGELGGFGAGEAAVLPWIFHAMTVAAPFLGGFLASKTLDNSNIIIREIHSALNARKSTLQNQAQSSQQQERLLSAPPQGQPGNAARQLQQCAGEMAKALQKAGLSQEESERVAYKVIFVLWEDAPDAIVFLRKITEKK
jgi:hypothetical protein